MPFASPSLWVLAEHRITYADDRVVRFRFRDYAEGGRSGYKTLKVHTFLGRLIRHIPDKRFPMIRHAGLFANRWKGRYLAQVQAARQPSESAPERSETRVRSWAQRQVEYRGRDPLACPRCGEAMTHVCYHFGPWAGMQDVFRRAGRDPTIPAVLRRTG